jgi:hypothetical protein
MVRIASGPEREGMFIYSMLVKTLNDIYDVLNWKL